jgi:hypothetical protein
VDFSRRVDSLLGVSIYEPNHGYGPTLDSPTVESGRRAMGGMIQPIPETQLRWYLADLEVAQAEADSGNLARAAQLYRAMRRDGVLMGLMATRTSGLVRLPKRFYGDSKIVDELKKFNGSRSVFDEMCPPSELAALTSDGDTIGVGVAELVPVKGRDYPVLVRLDPEWLQYVWAESRWYYLSRTGRIPVTPGDGRWVMHIPGGRIAPWQWGLWPALGRAFIMKEHAISLRGAYIAGVANPAKVMQSPSGAAEQQRRAMFQHVLRWGPNMAVELPVGWELKLLEANTGEGHKVFQAEIETCDLAYMVALAGQIVTTTGGSGFANADIHRVIRSDLIKASGEALAYTVNTQILPKYIFDHFGEAALDSGTSVEWDTATPKDLQQTAQTLLTFAQALAQLGALLEDQVDVAELCTRFDIPLKPKDGLGVGERQNPGPALKLVEQAPEKPPTPKAPETATIRLAFEAPKVITATSEQRNASALGDLKDLQELQIPIDFVKAAKRLEKLDLPIDQEALREKHGR